MTQYFIFEDIKDASVNSIPYCIIDFETTGLSPKNSRVIEVGAVKVLHGEIVSTFTALVNPKSDIPYEITALTGITNAMVKRAKPFEKIANDLMKFVSDSVMVAHNFKFDAGFFTAEFERVGNSTQINGLCTAKLSRRLIPEAGKYNLEYLVGFLGIPLTRAHRALEDATATALLFIELLDRYKQVYPKSTLQELVRFSESPNPNKFVKSPRKFGKAFYELPDTPGVYCFLNNQGEIIYVGKAKSLRKRLFGYIRESSDFKAKRILRKGNSLQTFSTNSELTALLTEAELIKQTDPTQNVMLKKYFHKSFLRIDRLKSFPVPELVNEIFNDGADYFGLFAGRRDIRKFLELLEKSFMLRECSDAKLAKGVECYLAKIERCTAPCNNGNADLYSNEIERLYTFLSGDNSYALKRLVDKMKLFSDQRRFEHASMMKDLIQDLMKQVNKIALLGEPLNKANVLFEIRGGVTPDYILFKEGKVYIKDYMLDTNRMFYSELESFYYNHTLFNSLPNEEDLEKIKIIIGWVIKNKESVSIHYLKNYKSLEQLASRLSSKRFTEGSSKQQLFELSDLLD